MNKYKVIIASTIYYKAEVQAENESEINEMFNNHDFDFTTWHEVALDSQIYSIDEVK